MSGSNQAWNEPPKFDYDQSRLGAKNPFKHRYVSPDVGQVTNMLHQPVMNQQNNQSHYNYGLTLGQHQIDSDVSGIPPASTVSNQISQFYLQQQQNQIMLAQQPHIYNQYQNHNNYQLQNQQQQQQPVPITQTYPLPNEPQQLLPLETRPSVTFNQFQSNDYQQQPVSTSLWQQEKPIQQPLQTIQQEHKQQLQPQSQPPLGPPLAPPPAQPAQPAPLAPSGPTQSTHSRYNGPTIDACSDIVQSLSRHICGDDEFCTRAIESLVKKMKEKRDELDALITAVTTNGAVPTQCVTIQRTLDGRLQVAGRKGFPHVIYAKIWRWPDLTRNELKPIRTCQYGFHMKADLICVNPYHYDRVISADGINWDMGGLSLSPYDQTNIFDDELSPPMSNVLSDHESPTQPHDEQHHSQISSLEGSSQPLTIIPRDQNQVPVSDVHIKGEEINYSTSQQKSTIVNDGALTPSTSVLTGPTQNHSLQTHPTENWATILYFELDQQIDQSFNVPCHVPTVTIDGYTLPSAEDRFCLGSLHNNHRSPAVSKVRLHIGRGIKLDNEDEHVWLENLSEKAIFLNSPFLDYESKRTIGNAVHKIYPRMRLKVFDLRQIHMMLSERAYTARMAATAEADAVAGILNGNLENNDQLAATDGIGADDLRKYCVLSLSFVKGWGVDYPKRHTIKQCPCWIEITMHRALYLLDDLLRYKL